MPRDEWLHDWAAKTWFVTKQETIEVKMVDSSLESAFRAAESLKARFFIRQVSGEPGDPVPTWGVWDTLTLLSGRNAPGGWPPTRVFQSETRDGAIMWALTRGA